MYGFLMPEPADDFAFQGRDEDYPEALQETTAKGGIRLKAAYRRNRAVDSLLLKLLHTPPQPRPKRERVVATANPIGDERKNARHRKGVFIKGKLGRRY
jgi:hypothetical protein